MPHAFAQHRRQGTALPGWGRAGPTSLRWPDRASSSGHRSSRPRLNAHRYSGGGYTFAPGRDLDRCADVLEADQVAQVRRIANGRGVDGRDHIPLGEAGSVAKLGVG